MDTLLHGSLTGLRRNEKQSSKQSDQASTHSSYQKRRPTFGFFNCQHKIKKQKNLSFNPGDFVRSALKDLPFREGFKQT